MAPFQEPENATCLCFDLFPFLIRKCCCSGNPSLSFSSSSAAQPLQAQPLEQLTSRASVSFALSCDLAKGLSRGFPSHLQSLGSHSASCFIRVSRELRSEPVYNLQQRLTCTQWCRSECNCFCERDGPSSEPLCHPHQTRRREGPRRPMHTCCSVQHVCKTKQS